MLKQYAAAGVDHVLALRGDPKGGPRAPWEPHPDGMDHAIDLVELVRDLGGFCIGVAAFPEGHPDAASLDADAEVLVAKAGAGAEFAITQLFFRADDYFGLVERVRARGCDIPIVPGIMPILNFARSRAWPSCPVRSSRARCSTRSSRSPTTTPPYAPRASSSPPSCAATCSAGGAPGCTSSPSTGRKATREIFEQLRADGLV